MNCCTQDELRKTSVNEKNVCDAQTPSAKREREKKSTDHVTGQQLNKFTIPALLTPRHNR